MKNEQTRANKRPLSLYSSHAGQLCSAQTLLCIPTRTYFYANLYQTAQKHSSRLKRDKAIPKSKSARTESNPISNETLALIKEKRKLRRQYSQRKDPVVKTLINQLQKQVKDDLRIESQASWEKFCNSISLETDSNESWRRIKNFLKPKGQRDYPTLQHASKVAKTNADKAQLFAESVERHFGIESVILIQITSMRSTNS